MIGTQNPDCKHHNQRQQHIVPIIASQLPAPVDLAAGVAAPARATRDHFTPSSSGGEDPTAKENPDWVAWFLVTPASSPMSVRRSQETRISWLAPTPFFSGANPAYWL
jgi:hypothetical protein